MFDEEFEFVEEGFFDGFLSDTEADADALRNVGWGTDEDYGFFDND